MHIERIEHGLDDYLLVESGEPRAPGLHVSDLYGRLYQRIDPRRFTDTPPNPLLLALGLAWERYFADVLRASGLDAERPAPFTSPEGVHFSPDGLLFNGQNRVIELKLTHKAASDDLGGDKFAHWITQTKAYCHLLGIPRARFYVLFDSYKPELRAFDVEYSADELRDNWQMLLNFGRAERLL